VKTESKDTSSQHFLDVPISTFHNDTETKTTLRAELKKVKVALIVNVASKCGHTKRHYEEMV